MSATYVCKCCNKTRRLNIKYPPVQNTCLRCRLRTNKVLTLKAFASIVKTEDNKEFKKQVEEWYLNDA